LSGYHRLIWLFGRCGHAVGLRAHRKGLMSLFRQVNERGKPEDPEEKMRELAGLSNSLKRPRDVLKVRAS
jgi:hypothetical protein